MAKNNPAGALQDEVMESGGLAELLESFDIDGDLVGIAPYGSGHLHKTMRGEWISPRGTKSFFIHQCINTGIFRNVDVLMHNISLATTHLRQTFMRAGAHEEEALEIIPTRSGALYARGADGSCWRTYAFVKDAESYECCRDERHAQEAARAFGRFNALLANLNPDDFPAVIPNFIDTTWRFAQLKDAAHEDRAGRRAAIARELDFAFAHEEEGGLIMRGLRGGDFPWKVTHNDMKLNNLLFSRASGRAKCVVDLDTVMPGSNLYDFGDLVRTSSMHVEEDERDLSRVVMDPDYFDALTSGFLRGVADGLTPEELEVLHIAPRIIALTIGIRFLADYLAGDVYFRVHRPEHNLDRARCQFALVESMERQASQMRKAVLAAS